MRYVSEQFLEKQNQLIRPPLKMRFEVCTDVMRYINTTHYADYPIFDTSVAPIILPMDCTNEYYYAVVGDGIGVDDPNKMCAPVDNSGFATPNHAVPLGVTTVVSANSEAMLGSNTFYYNFIGLSSDTTLSFKGGLIPEEIRVEVYNISTSTWSTEETIYNPELLEEIPYPYSASFGQYHRFFLKNTTKSGRYQFNWLRRDWASYNNAPPVVFENNYISSAMIDEGTDLTSQAEPNYDLTVTCLDVNGIYAPESEYWENNKQFTDRKDCVLYVGYKNGNDVEYVPMLMGTLTQKPTYDHGKITFKVSAWAGKALNSYNFYSQPDASLNVGDEVYSRKFSLLFSGGGMFDNVDVFHDATDDNNSVFNDYNFFKGGDARKLVANALGGYITVVKNQANLFNTCDIQYKTPVDYLTRYEQVKITLDSQPKVSTVNITRNLNTLSADYVDIEAAERVSITADTSSVTTYFLPFYAFGKAIVVDYQSSVPSAIVSVVGSIGESQRPNGDIRAQIFIRSNVATTVKPIVRFYRVDNTQFVENETVGSNGSENYYNDNELITNSYTADKAKRVAKFISDVSNQYEVDVVQDVRYELGDVIRLETQKNVFKTCVITGLKFNFPGSKGHVTCRKIFNYQDSSYAITDMNNAEIATYTIGGYIKILEAEKETCVIGLIKNTDLDRYYFIVLGALNSEYQRGSDDPVVISPQITVTDNNSHDWKFTAFWSDDTTYTFTPVDLGTWDNTTSVANVYAYGAMTLIMKLYEEQNMTSPVDYDCAYTVT